MREEFAALVKRSHGCQTSPFPICISGLVFRNRLVHTLCQCVGVDRDGALRERFSSRRRKGFGFGGKSLGRIMDFWRVLFATWHKE